MTTDELRKLYLDFFIERDHTLVSSDSLVPTYDPSLLFSGAGMNQFKDEFLGRGKRPLKRACSSQKCIRTGDIDSVGVTTSHHVFFEMLGNFSFGDYFKREAIRWGWEFCVDVLKLPDDRLNVSIYENDEEAYSFWQSEVNLPDEKIFRLGAHENFWPADAPTESPAGQLCGPCSEIFYDWGPTGCTDPDCNPSCDCGRHVEIWNLVFQQFEKGAGPGELHELPQKNIDTGAGLERIAAVMQGVKSDFDLDIFKPLIAEAERLTGARVEGADAEGMKHLRRIADYMRAVSFLIADGVLPANDGRGYVERRLLRRSVLAGRALGASGPFCYNMVAPVAELMGGQYPEVRERRENIARIIKAEEEKFERTLGAGVARMNELIAAVRKSGETGLPGGEAFRLYDTYGFPVELAEDMLHAEGLTLDRAGFEAEVEKQRARARAGSAFTQDVFGDVIGKVKEITGGTEFVRDWKDGGTAKVLAIMKGSDLVEEAQVGEGVSIVLDRTPFYGEAGGQVGDQGELKWEGGAAHIFDTVRADEVFLHRADRNLAVDSGSLRIGQTVIPKINKTRRRAIEANHTVTHILHHYLREVLGKHVEQAGSLVDAERLRLDFTHFEAAGPEELRRVEELVNEAIRSGGSVETRETGVGEARAAGAMALFGEKYGETVRMVTTDLGVGKSIELCGGTHLDNVQDAGCFRIEKEESVASGMRRITALTGMGAVERGNEDRAALRAVDSALALSADDDQDGDAGLKARDELEALCRVVKCQREGVVDKLKALVSHSGLDAAALAKLPTGRKERAAALAKAARKAEKRAAGERASLLAGRGKEIAAAARELAGGAKFASAALEGVGAKDLRRLADEVRAALPSGVVFLASNSGGKAALVATVSEDLVKKGVKAGDIVKAAAARVGGGGGGRPNMAQAGGPEPENIPAAIEAAAGAVEAAQS